MTLGTHLDYQNALESERAVDLAHAALRGDFGKFKSFVQGISTSILERRIPIQDLRAPFPLYNFASFITNASPISGVYSETQQGAPNAVSYEQTTISLIEIMFNTCHHVVKKPEEQLHLSMFSLLLRAMKAQNLMVPPELYILPSGPLLSPPVTKMIWNHDVSLMPMNGPLSISKLLRDCRARECRKGLATCSEQGHGRNLEDVSCIEKFIFDNEWQSAS